MPRIVDHELQRHELSATVAEVIAQAGLENTTLRTVAAGHGCTKGMVQHYFVDKEALLLAALVLVEDRFRTSAAAAAGDRRGLDRVQAVLKAQLPVSGTSRRDWRVRLAFYCQPEPGGRMSHTLGHYRLRQQKLLLSGLRQADGAGEICNGLSLPDRCRSLQALLWGLGVNALAARGRASPAAQRRVISAAISNLRT
jgi:AcrR family transcriptional regulator